MRRAKTSFSDFSSKLLISQQGRWWAPGVSRVPTLPSVPPTVLWILPGLLEVKLIISINMIIRITFFRIDTCGDQRISSSLLPHHYHCYHWHYDLFSWNWHFKGYRYRHRYCLISLLPLTLRSFFCLQNRHWRWPEDIQGGVHVPWYQGHHWEGKKH